MVYSKLKKRNSKRNSAGKGSSQKKSNSKRSSQKKSKSNIKTGMFIGAINGSNRFIQSSKNKSK